MQLTPIFASAFTTAWCIIIVPSAIVAVGQIKSAAIRIRIFKTLQKLNVTLPVIISPYAYISKHAIK